MTKLGTLGASNEVDIKVIIENDTDQIIYEGKGEVVIDSNPIYDDYSYDGVYTNKKIRVSENISTNISWHPNKDGTSVKVTQKKKPVKVEEVISKVIVTLPYDECVFEAREGEYINWNIDRGTLSLHKILKGKVSIQDIATFNEGWTSVRRI